MTDELTWLGIPQANQVASALTLLWKWNNDGLEQWRPSTKAELLSELERTPWVSDSVRAARAVWEQTRINQSAVACVHAELTRAGMEAKAQDWIDYVAAGVGYSEGDPALALRNYAGRVAATKSVRVRGEVWLAITIKCFNYWYLGQSIKNLSWRRRAGEDFPVLVVEVDA